MTQDSVAELMLVTPWRAEGPVYGKNVVYSEREAETETPQGSGTVHDGEYISRKIASAEWGAGVVEELAASLAHRFPGLRGFTRPNLFRMRQFFEAYRANRKVSALLRQLPWTHHLIILGQAKPAETRAFYILAAVRERWSSRELERQIRSGAALRGTPKTTKVSAALTQTHPTAIEEFKNAYNLEFLSQVGAQGFAIDLLFFHRVLQCLVAFELKVGKFKPADLGQLSFYVEALDRDVKKQHEHPSIGVLLCATKEDEVVEYALARTMSPTLVAEYQTVLPPKSLLRAKLHELYARLAAEPDDPSPPKRKPTKRVLRRAKAGRR